MLIGNWCISKWIDSCRQFTNESRHLILAMLPTTSISEIPMAEKTIRLKTYSGEVLQTNWLHGATQCRVNIIIYHYSNPWKQANFKGLDVTWGNIHYTENILCWHCEALVKKIRHCPLRKQCTHSHNISLICKPRAVMYVLKSSFWNERQTRIKW